MFRSCLSVLLVVILADVGFSQVEIGRLLEGEGQHLRLEWRQQSRLDKLKAEQSAWKALQQPAKNWEWFESPLAEVATRIKEDHNIRILLDQPGLDEAHIGSDTLITKGLKDKGFTLLAALDWTLSDHQLAIVVIDGYVVITSQERAENHLYRRIYPVPDLAGAKDERGAQSDCRELVELIRETVAPNSWRRSAEADTAAEVEGIALGFIGASSPTGSIVVLQTRKVHEDIDVLLATLREAREQQNAAAVVPQPTPKSQPLKPAR